MYENNSKSSNTVLIQHNGPRTGKTCQNRI